MSLHDIAKHVESQGRGEDTVLVHMTPHEVGGLQALAKAHGGSLTRNPQTGLYEAGFLSSILPMVAGVATAAFAPELLPLVAGGIGVADYAMTGSISQGLMAGLGAWSGGSLASGLSAAGESAIATAGGDTANAAFDASQKAAADLAQGPVQASQVASQQIGSMPNLTPDQVSNMTGQGLTDANAAQVVRGAGAANAAMGATPAAGMMAGISSPSAIGSAISSNPGAAAGVAGSLLLGNGNLFKPTSAAIPANTTVTQPLSRLSPNYQPNVVTTPTTHYQASYPNYAANPYNPYATQAAEGGLMGIQKYAVGGDVSQVSPEKTDFMAAGGMYPQSQIDKTQFATPSQMPASAAVMNADFDTKTNPLTGAQVQSMADGGISSLPPKTLPTIAPFSGTTPTVSGSAQPQALPVHAATSPIDAYIAGYNQASQPMLSGGQLPQATPAPATPAPVTTYNPANIPTPTRAPSPASTGYAIDPTKMQGSPAYIKAQADAAAANQDPFGNSLSFQQYQQQQYQQYLNAQNSSGAGSGAAGGLPKDFAYAGGGILAFAGKEGSQVKSGNKDMQAIDDYTAQAGQDGGLSSVVSAAQGGDWNAMIALQKLGYQQGKDFAVGGGISDLGSYSDGGRLLKGPGDGVSDNIPAQIGSHQPARLADGEFVVPARIVSELGNGSTDAGAKRLYAMMDRVQAKRKKSMGKGKFAVNSKAEKDLPA